jgi:hypothetical protein
MASKAEQEAAAKAAIDLATEQKGTQSITVSANVDPTAYVQFKVREDLIKHFDIKPYAPSIADGDKVFVAKRKAVTGGTGKKPVTVVNAGAGTVKSSSSQIIGRAIKIPTSGGYTRKVKGSQKAIKEVTVRVPSNMSLAAICLWINSAFTQASKKPTYFKTPAGARVSINGSFTDKSKLANKKNE